MAEAILKRQLEHFTGKSRGGLDAQLTPNTERLVRHIFDKAPEDAKKDFAGAVDKMLRATDHPDHWQLFDHHFEATHPDNRGAFLQHLATELKPRMGDHEISIAVQKAFLKAHAKPFKLGAFFQRARAALKPRNK